MADLILIDGDQAVFMPAFGPAIVAVRPGIITASGDATLNGKKICIDGDEKSVEVAGCAYLTPTHPIPGSGTIYIESLAPDQVAGHTGSKDKPVLLKGGMFKARFQVSAPAIQPGVPPVPDSASSYSGGQGQFVTKNTKFRAT